MIVGKASSSFDKPRESRTWRRYAKAAFLHFQMLYAKYIIG